VFIGGSIVPKGGQNPLEAIRLGCQIVHGKHIENFKEIFTMLSAKKMSFKVNNEQNLYKKIIKLLKRKNNNKKQIKKFKKIGNLILANYFNEIRNFI
jgi:3-deoxy-D-manno-octulosonic-acid transferase